jgi:hypothetical protein
MQSRPGLSCPVCRSQRITPPTASGISSDATHIRYQTPDGGFLSQGIILVGVGCVCLDCGYMMFFLSPEALERARQQTTFVPW